MIKRLILTCTLATTACDQPSTDVVESIEHACGDTDTSTTPAPARLEEVYFTASNDGTIQAYAVIFPEGFDATVPRDMLIALHGAGANRGQFATNNRDEARAARDAATARHMLFVSPDYRQTDSWMNQKAEEDVVQIITDIMATTAIERVFITGASMGGSGALTFAVRRPGVVDGVVAMNPMANFLEYTGFQNAITAAFGGTKLEIPTEYKARSSEYFPELLLDIPVAFAAGAHDAVVPPDSVVRLNLVLEMIGGETLMLLNPVGEHSTSYADATTAFEFVLGAP